jgi:hypothetical protein
VTHPTPAQIAARLRRWRHDTAGSDGLFLSHGQVAELLTALDALADVGDAGAPTQKLPPVRESLGPRRRPPVPIVQELRERTELLAALVEELAAYDEDEQP